MDMSSYQFVNTLAQCYEANAQLQGAGAAAAGAGVAGSTAPQDYYGMQYPNCYSPATQVTTCDDAVHCSEVQVRLTYYTLVPGSAVLGKIAAAVPAL